MSEQVENKKEAKNEELENEYDQQRSKKK